MLNSLLLHSTLHGVWRRKRENILELDRTGLFPNWRVCLVWANENGLRYSKTLTSTEWCMPKWRSILQLNKTAVYTVSILSFKSCVDCDAGLTFKLSKSQSMSPQTVLCRTALIRMTIICVVITWPPGSNHFTVKLPLHVETFSWNLCATANETSFTKWCYTVKLLFFHHCDRCEPLQK